jgi:glycosyltransferase involved in cell wall biosynthesis
MVRIGFDARAVRYHGIGTYSRNLLQNYAASPHEFIIFCQDQEKESLQSADSFTFVSANSDPVASGGRAGFRALVESAGVDLLHVPSTWAPTPLRVPLVATIHDVVPLLYPRSLHGPLGRFRYKRQLKQTLEEAVCIITVSQISRSTLSMYAGVEAAKVRVIHNGVSEKFYPVDDAAALDAVRRRYALPARFAVWVGDFRPEKNLIFLVDAWARLLNRLAEPLPLVLAGALAGSYRDVRKEAERRGLHGQVFFPGFIRDSDLPTLYSAATVFVFPSLYEGFGLPPLEAMACGTPCLVSNSSSLPEVTGGAAALFNPTSLDQFVECAHRVLTDEAAYASMRAKGLEQSSRFRWETAAEETLEVYDSVLAGLPG